MEEAGINGRTRLRPKALRRKPKTNGLRSEVITSGHPSPNLQHSWHFHPPAILFPA